MGPIPDNRRSDAVTQRLPASSLAEGIRPELKARGVDVIACAPGPIASGFGERAGKRMGMSQPAAAVAAETLDAL